MIKAVLFDLDNTLYDYTTADRIAEEALYENVVKLIGPMDREEFARQYKIAKTEIKRELRGTASSHNRALYIQRFLEIHNVSFDPEIILKLYDCYWDKLLEVMQPLEGLIPVLRELQEMGVKIGIVTNLTAHIQLRKIKKLQIQEFIDILVTSEETGTEKPHSAMFLVAANKLGVLPTQCMFVGDNIDSDTEGANAVGMKTVCIFFGEHATQVASEGAEEPNFTVWRLSEIIGIVKRLNDSTEAQKSC